MPSGGAEVSLAGSCGFWNLGLLSTPVQGLRSLHPRAALAGRVALGVAGPIGRGKGHWNLSTTSSQSELDHGGTGRRATWDRTLILRVPPSTGIAHLATWLPGGRYECEQLGAERQLQICSSERVELPSSLCPELFPRLHRARAGSLLSSCSPGWIPYQ